MDEIWKNLPPVKSQILQFQTQTNNRIIKTPKASGKNRKIQIYQIVNIFVRKKFSKFFSGTNFENRAVPKISHQILVFFTEGKSQKSTNFTMAYQISQTVIGI